MMVVEKLGLQPQPDVLGLAEQAKTVPITTRHGTSGSSSRRRTMGQSVLSRPAGLKSSPTRVRLVSCEAG